MNPLDEIVAHLRAAQDAAQRITDPYERGRLHSVGGLIGIAADEVQRLRERRGSPDDARSAVLRERAEHADPERVRRMRAHVDRQIAGLPQPAPGPEADV